MATQKQAEFIKDLVLAKFRTFAEFRKWLATTGIVRTNGKIFKDSMNLIQILNRITPKQASEIITAAESLQDVEYKTAYDQEQIDEVKQIMTEISKEVGSWTFATQ